MSMFLSELWKSQRYTYAWTFGDVPLKIMIQYRTRSIHSVMAQNVLNHKLQLYINKKDRRKFLDIFNVQEVIHVSKKVLKVEDFLKVM